MINPLGDRVVLKMIDPPDVSKGGILLPDSAREKPQKGIVTNLGKGKKNLKGEYVPLSVKVGDTVLIAKWSGTEIHTDKNAYLIVNESDILGIFTS
jgi:chaperonin GroES